MCNTDIDIRYITISLIHQISLKINSFSYFDHYKLCPSNNENVKKIYMQFNAVYIHYGDSFLFI